MEQFTKDKKRTAMVLLSLAASLSVYLCIVTMLDSQISGNNVEELKKTKQKLTNYLAQNQR